MSATTDTFASFLEILADTMDDHEAPADSMASRVHLSRFHFDRLVAAAAGEPPAAGLRVPARRKVTAMNLLTRMIEHHVWLVGEMLARAETLPPNGSRRG